MEDLGVIATSALEPGETTEENSKDISSSENGYTHQKAQKTWYHQQVQIPQKAQPHQDSREAHPYQKPMHSAVPMEPESVEPKSVEPGSVPVLSSSSETSPTTLGGVATKKPTVCFFMLARGGSKGVPRKNIKMLNGKPLIAYQCQVARDSGVFDDLWISTEDKEIATIAREYCKVLTFDRDPKTATDNARCEDAVRDLVTKCGKKYDFYCMAQATQPLCSVEHYQEAYKKMTSGEWDSLLTVTVSHRFRWYQPKMGSGGIFPKNYDYRNRPNRQEWNGELCENGGFYWFTRDIIEKESRLGGRITYVEMPKASAIEIDDESDWDIMTVLVKTYAHKTEMDKTPIQIVFLDVDGVLTNATVLYDDKGPVYKAFSHRDGHGIVTLLNKGIHVVFLTRSEEAPIVARAKKLGVQLIAGCKDKLSAIESVCKERGVELASVAFMGDDIFDLKALKAVGLSGCPKDAEPSVLSSVQFRSNFEGGKHCARDFINYILERGGHRFEE